MEAETKNLYLVQAPAVLSGDAISTFEKSIRDLLQKGPDFISLDCSQLRHATSSHINALWLAYQRCADIGVELRLRSVPAGLVRVLKVLDLYELFTYEEQIASPQTKEATQFVLEDFQKRYDDKFRADADSINKALNRFIQFLVPMQLSQLIEFELRTVFYEVATNIVTHAGIRKDSSIVFTAKANDSKIVLIFADSGIPFDMTDHRATFDPRIAGKNGQKHGLGITMIRKLTDRISYIRENDLTNVLRIEKVWR